MPLGKKAVVTGIKGVGYFKKNYPNLYKALSPKTLIDYKRFLHKKIPSKAIQQRLGMMDMIAQTEGHTSLYKAMESDGYDFFKYSQTLKDVPAVAKALPTNVDLKGMSIPKSAIKKPIKKTLGKVLPFKPKKLLIPGAIGAAALGSELLQPDTAEAGIKSKVVKLGTKQLGKLSRAHHKLKGANIKGRVVKAVHKGRGNNRVLVFTDDTYLVVDKKYITSASAALGREKYMSRFATEPARGKSKQATKSLLQRRAVAAKPRPSSQVRSQALEYQENIEKLDLKPIRHRNVLVNYNRRTFSIPEPYALKLQKELKGELSILTKQPVSPIQELPSLKVDALKEIQKRLKGKR